MQRALLAPLASLALILAACADGATTALTAPQGGLSAARGAGAHFIKNATTAQRDGDNLVVSFKEAGLAAGSVETITATATATATYQCVNNGGNVPNDPKKTTVAQQVSASDTFTADQNGNLVGSITVTPPPAPESFSCPNGQNVSGPLDVTYTNVSITDATSGATLPIRGTF